MALPETRRQSPRNKRSPATHSKDNTIPVTLTTTMANSGVAIT